MDDDPLIQGIRQRADELDTAKRDKHAAEQEATRLQKKVTATQEASLTLKAELEAAQKATEVAKKEMAAARNAAALIVAGMQTEKEEARKKTDLTRKEIELAKEEIAGLWVQIEGLVEEVKDAKEEAKLEMDVVREEAKSEMDVVREEVSGLETRIHALLMESEYDKLSSGKAVTGFQTQIEALKTDLEDEKKEAKKEISDLKIRVDALVEELEGEKESASKEVAGMRIRAEGLVAQLEDVNKRAVTIRSLANEEISQLTQHAEELQNELEREKQSSGAEISRLKTQAESLTSEIAEAKKETEIAKGKMQFAKIEMELAKKRAQTAVQEASSARQQTLASKITANKASKINEEQAKPAEPTLNNGPTAAQHQAHIDIMARQLQVRDDEINRLQKELQEEVQMHEAIQQTAIADLRAARGVSVDFMRFCLDKMPPGEQAKREFTIKLRKHKWVLSRIADLPDRLCQPSVQHSKPVQLGEEPVITPKSPPRQQEDELFLSNVDPLLPQRRSSHQYEASIETAAPSLYGAQDPRRIGRSLDSTTRALETARTPGSQRVCHTSNAIGTEREPPRSSHHSGTPCCSTCYKRQQNCTGGAQCRQCWEAGCRCVYKYCNYGADCPYPECKAVHPGQEIMRGEELFVQYGSGNGNKRRRLQ